MTLLGLNNFTHSRRMNSVVVDNDVSTNSVNSMFHSLEKEGAVLICKGDPETMKPLLVLDDHEKLQYE